MTTTIALIMTAMVLAIAGMAVYIWNLSCDNDKLRADISRNFYEEQMKAHKRYRKIVRFLDSHAMPQNRLDEEVKSYQEDGWTFDKEYCTINGLLAFFKFEKVGGNTGDNNGGGSQDTGGGLEP